MVLQHDTPHALRWLRAGHRHLHTSLAAVLAVGVLALCASTVHVVDRAVAIAPVSLPATHEVSDTSAGFENGGPGASAMTVDLIELPPASVDAISL